MVTTSDKPSADRLRLIVNHGQSEKYLHTTLGYNYRMTDIAAAIGIVQLKKLDKFNLRRRKNAEYYAANLSAKGLVKPRVADGVQHVSTTSMSSGSRRSSRSPGRRLQTT